MALSSDDQAMKYIFWSAVDAVDRGHIRADDRLYQLKALQDSSRKNEVSADDTILLFKENTSKIDQSREKKWFSFYINLLIL